MKSQKFLSLAALIFWALALNFISLNVYADDVRNRADYTHNRGDDEHNRWDHDHTRWDDEHYVYTNDGQGDNTVDPHVLNTVTGFEVARNGSLTKIGQWSTGGIGCPHGFIAATRANASKNGDLLFVSNGFGVGDQLTNGTCPSVAATISVFRGASHGKLHLVKVISDPANLTPGDTSVASFGNCLIVGSTNGKKLISYKLPAVTHVNTLSLGDGIIDMKVTKVGEKRYAAATLFHTLIPAPSPPASPIPFNNQIAVTRINSNTCSLETPTIIDTAGGVAGPYGGSAGIGFSPDGRKMYVGDANFGRTIVEAFEFPSGTPLPGSPYILPSGDDSETVLVSKDGKCLFAANQFSATVTSIPLRNGVPGTSFTTNPVSVFTDESPNLPIGMANDINGKMLYVGIHPDNSVAQDNTVITEFIGKGDCSLTGARGGAVPTGVKSDLGFQTSIVATGDD